MGGSKESQRVPRIGISSPVTESGMRDWWKALIMGLEELGYVEGRDIEFVWRFADGRFERLPDLAVELASLEVDVIMPATPPAILAAKVATNTIAIVFPLGSDPIETGPRFGAVARYSLDPVVVCLTKALVHACRTCGLTRRSTGPAGTGLRLGLVSARRAG